MLGHNGLRTGNMLTRYALMLLGEEAVSNEPKQVTPKADRAKAGQTGLDAAGVLTSRPRLTRSLREAPWKLKQRFLGKLHPRLSARVSAEIFLPYMRAINMRVNLRR